MVRPDPAATSWPALLLLVLDDPGVAGRRVVVDVELAVLLEVRVERDGVHAPLAVRAHAAAQVQQGAPHLALLGHDPDAAGTLDHVQQPVAGAVARDVDRVDVAQVGDLLQLELDLAGLEARLAARTRCPATWTAVTARARWGGRRDERMP